MSQPVHLRAAADAAPALRLAACAGSNAGASAAPALTRRACALALAALATGAAAASARSPRLITVGGSLTEAVFALGAEAQLVGTDTTSLYPAAAQATPKVGYMRQLSAEGLLALRPDVVLALAGSGPPLVLQQLHSARVQVELIERRHEWDDVRRTVQAAGRATGRGAAAQDLLRQLEQEWTRVRAQVQAYRGPTPRALFIMAHGGSPLVAGGQTAAHAMLTLAGARNVVSGFNGFRPLTAESMAAAAPDVIVTTTQSLQAVGGAEGFWRRPELALTPAWQRRHSGAALWHQDALALLGFGPRLAQVLEALHRGLIAA
ncbi:ABC-type hemin transport system, periplasmic component [Serpentinimonas maccroryi]|uniref:ABC-type hemin transport system, periplasmic component n=1 Tax=Serpentinimonas maccroryi TaxID=1458426 RepID=A0A060NY27_9BURK|nr:ABC transporter substrate-binding protein [Serpentinimonas maccroryi]BAO83784.1 ABC-type hemin transport system, periplasmic component [Serpentinimonas maccroryi]